MNCFFHFNIFFFSLLHLFPWTNFGNTCWNLYSSGINFLLFHLFSLKDFLRTLLVSFKLINLLFFMLLLSSFHYNFINFTYFIFKNHVFYLLNLSSYCYLFFGNLIILKLFSIPTLWLYLNFCLKELFFLFLF